MQFIQRYFGVLLLISCLIGLIIPSAGDSTSLIVLLSLACIIFCSFFQITLSRETFKTDIRLSFLFYLLRYLALPVIVFFLFKWVSSFYAIALLLSFLLPAAVSSPAFSMIYSGKPDLSLKILLISSFLSVLAIPVIMALLSGPTVKVPAGDMLLTLIYTIVIPFILHLPVRKSTFVKELVTKYNSVFTLVGLCLIFMVVTARNKPDIFANPALVGLFAVEAIVLYGLLYCIGYYIFSKSDLHVRRTLSISSGANNIGLGVTITALFFPGEMNIFFIVSQLAWVVMLIPLRKIFKS